VLEINNMLQISCETLVDIGLEFLICTVGIVVLIATAVNHTAPTAAACRGRGTALRPSGSLLSIGK